MLFGPSRSAPPARAMRGLYAIVDVETLAARAIDPLDFARAVLSVGPAALQLRAKRTSAREILALLRALAPLCRNAAVPLVVNDHPDLANLAGCPFVHLGQTDMAIDKVRRIVPTVAVGLSTHNLSQLDLALAARPAYVAFGPVFSTASKADADPVVGTEMLRAAHARAVAAGVPLVAIGGISRARAASLVGIADAIAVIGDLVPLPVASGRDPPSARLAGEILEEVVARARALHALFA
jgi:thiamine-phosphate pyrophosphorylase